MQKILEESKRNLMELAGKYQNLLNETSDLEKNFTDNKTQYLEKINSIESEKQRAENLLNESIQNEKNLNTKVVYLDHGFGSIHDFK